MSSRNVRLSPEERAQAPVLYRALIGGADSAVENGERDAGAAQGRASAPCSADADLARIDYVEIVDADDLAAGGRPLPGACLIALAVWFGPTG